MTMATAYPDSWLALDLETTGLNPSRDRIIEIGVVVVRPGQPIVPESVLIRLETQDELPDIITQITGLKRKDLDEGIPIRDALDWLRERLRGCDAIVGHNALAFDWPFIRAEFARSGGGWTLAESGTPVLDTAGLFIAHMTQRPRREDESLHGFAARMIGERLNHQKYNLKLACETLGVDLSGITAHRAAGDALMTQRLFEALREAGVGVATAKRESVRL